MAIFTQSGDEFKQWLTEKTTAERIPIGISMELTARCNFRCVHCYMGALRDDNNRMDFVLIHRILTEAEKIGCLSVGFTGGEPLLRPDYADIHALAHSRGFFISLLTNGSLLTDKLIELFQQMPPRTVEISLYGGDEQSYLNVTGVHGAFRNVAKNIDKLLDIGIHVLLKSVLLAPILTSVKTMNQFAASRGLQIVYDPAVTSDVQHNIAPTHLRIAPRCAVEIELKSSKAARHLHASVPFRNETPNPTTPVCGAGHRGFHVDYRGNMQQCVSLRTPSVSLTDHSVSDAWAKLASFPRPLFPPKSLCSTCALQRWCAYCPGAMACGDPVPTSTDSFYCRMAQARFDKVTKHKKQ